MPKKPETGHQLKQATVENAGNILMRGIERLAETVVYGAALVMMAVVGELEEHYDRKTYKLSGGDQ